MVALLGSIPTDISEEYDPLYRRDDQGALVADMPAFDDRGLDLPVDPDSLVDLSSSNSDDEEGSEETKDDGLMRASPPSERELLRALEDDDTEDPPAVDSPRSARVLRRSGPTPRTMRASPRAASGKGAAAPPPEGSPHSSGAVETLIPPPSESQPKDGAAVARADADPPAMTPRGDLLTSPGGGATMGPVEEHRARLLDAAKATLKGSEGTPTFIVKEKKKKWIAHRRRSRRVLSRRSPRS